MGAGLELQRRVKLSRLYDLYGPLLTQRQRQVYELHDLEDLSLSEISQELDISRQAVSDQLQRGRERLEELEELLGLDQRLREMELRLEVLVRLDPGSDGGFRRLIQEILNLCQRGTADHV